MAEDGYYFDNFTTLDMTTSGGTTVPIAGITDVSMVPSVSIEQLRTGDSATIEEQQHHEFEVSINIGRAKFDQDATMVQQWLGGSGSSSTTFTDTNDPQKFTVSADWDDVGSDRTLTAEVRGITFEEMPVIDGSMGEYLAWDIDGTGEEITVEMQDNTSP